MAALPNLHLKWIAFQELADAKGKDAWIGQHVFGASDGAQRFSKLLRGDLGCSPAVAQSLTRFMNEWISNVRTRAGATAKNQPTTTLLAPVDLELPVLTFVARLIALLGPAATGNIERAHKALLESMTLGAPRGRAPESLSEGVQPRLQIERFGRDRSFPEAKASGGDGPVVFEVGKHTGQLAVINAKGPPIAAYTVFARDPAPIGKRVWDLSWGEVVMWIPAPARPLFSDGRVVLLPQAQPVNPMPGRWIVTCTLVWKRDAVGHLDPRGEGMSPTVLDEVETSRFLTNMRRMTEDKRKQWDGAISVSQAEYVVKA